MNLFIFQYKLLPITILMLVLYACTNSLPERPTPLPEKPMPTPIAQYPIDIKNYSILFIGDSHTAGIFGKKLTELLTERIPNAEVTTVASCGSSPNWWLVGTATHCGFWRRNSDGSQEKGNSAATPLLDELLSSLHPKTVIIALGSNLIPKNNTQQRLETEILMQRVTKTSQCIWIGPPDARKFSFSQTRAVYDLLFELGDQLHCPVINSLQYTKYPTDGDGLHYGGISGTPIAESWAEEVMRDIAEQITIPQELSQ